MPMSKCRLRARPARTRYFPGAVTLATAARQTPFGSGNMGSTSCREPSAGNSTRSTFSSTPPSAWARTSSPPP